MDKITDEIIKETKEWDLNTWKNFRSLNNYWYLRDNAYNTKNQEAIELFRIHKLKLIIKYNKL